MTDIYSQRKLIAALVDPACYPHRAKTVRLIETHISWVLLAGRYAYKIKKAVDLSFLNFTTLQARQHYCNEEIRLNHRLAPQIYLDVVPIGGSHEHPELGKQPPIEYAVRMRRFASGKLLSRLIKQDKLLAQHMDSLAALLAHFHSGLAATVPDSSFGSAPLIRAAAIQNFEQMRPLLPEEVAQQLLTAIERSAAKEYEKCEHIFNQRLTRGWVRECHGDLHLNNIVLIGDEPVPFDGIEFNPSLRWLDVMDEVSFLVMDLLHHDRPDLAFRFLNAYLETTGDYEGVAVLRFYLAYRAMVRAKVSAIRLNQPNQTKNRPNAEVAECHSYLTLASRILEQHRPALIITHGLPGSGKTTFAQFALEQFGAIRIRSDIERKRLFGLSPLDDSRSKAGAGIYSTDANQRTYARLLELAQHILGAGFPVIVDAAFLKNGERLQFHNLARDMSIPFAIATISAQTATLQSRLIQRRANALDASEADIEVLQLLQSAQEALTAKECDFAAAFTNDESAGNFSIQPGWSRLKKLIRQP